MVMSFVRRPNASASGEGPHHRAPGWRANRAESSFRAAPRTASDEKSDPLRAELGAVLQRDADSAPVGYENLADVRVRLDLCAVLLRGDDRQTSVSRSKIVDDVGLRDRGELEHRLRNFVPGWREVNVWRSLRRLCSDDDYRGDASHEHGPRTHAVIL